MSIVCAHAIATAVGAQRASTRSDCGRAIHDERRTDDRRSSKHRHDNNWWVNTQQVKPTGSAAVGLPMAGSAALILAIQHPAQFGYAAALSGFLNPSEGWWPTLVGLAMGDAGGCKTVDMGAGQRPGVEAQRPHGQHRDLDCQRHPRRELQQRRRPRRRRRSAAGDNVPAKALEGLTVLTNRTFQDIYLTLGGRNGVFNLLPTGTHSWKYWGRQLQAMKPDLQRALGAQPPA
ncbi:alpha/beta hydrolase-fold protein [Mycolicibacterium grossiae]|uniref:alpha/beta hydrolase-fold protein n=1 Tax=Mycolicibacterium grossiae TaxID=1552759 RepID=UPI0009F56490|nr:alpha/beta hydrolase-fold protein [Mycolicibacterium grossiae]